VPDRDAFGNEIAPTDATAAFGAAPAPSAADTAAPPSRGAPALRTRRRTSARPPSPRGGTGQGFRRFATGFVTVSIVAGVLGALGLAGGGGAGAGDIEGPTMVSPPAMPESSDRRATPTRGGSLLRRPAFAGALTQLRRADFGQLNSLRITKARVDAVFLAGDERVRYVALLVGGRPEITRTGSTRLVIEEPLPLAEIDPGVPERLARAVARRTRRPVSSIDYLTFANVAGEPIWFVYDDSGRSYFADARGRMLSRAS